MTVAAELVPTGASVRYQYEDEPGTIVEETGKFLEELGDTSAKVLTPRGKIRVVSLADLHVEKLS